MGKLVLLEAGGKTRDIPLDRQRLTIGRRADNDLCLPFPAVSSEHAAVVTVLADSFLEDLGSTNGTLVNGRAIAKHLLRNGDRIDIGRQELVYFVDDSATLEAAGPKRARARAGLFGEQVQRVPPTAATEAGPADSMAPAPAPMPTPAPARTGRVPTPPCALRVETTIAPDRVVPLVNDETIVGRAGVQVIAIRRSGDEMRAVAIEGPTPPVLNGLPLPQDGARVAPGDVLQVAGSTLRVIALPTESV